MHQLRFDEVRRPLEPVGEVAASVRTRLEGAGIVFVEDDDPGLPAPSQTAAVELESGSQFAFEHFYAYGNGTIVVVRAQPGAMSPRDRLRELQEEIGLRDDEILAVTERW
jgi:hypothetical protein